MTRPVAALWRRLDVPGHDGWTLHGSAVLLQDGQVCQLRYDVVDYPELFTLAGGSFSAGSR